MTKKIGFYTTGVDQDNYMYVETAANESYSIGADVATGSFNINMSTSPGVTPDESTSNFAMDPTSGDVVMQSSGTGVLQLATGAGGMKAIGIAGTAVANAEYVSVDTSTGQLGSIAIPALYDVPGFFAVASVDINNLTGDGTTAFLVCDFVSVSNTSDGSSYDTGNGYFLCMTTGMYLFTVNLVMSGLVVDNTSMLVYLDQGGGQQLANFVNQNPYTAADSNGLLYQSYAITYRAVRGFQYNVRVKISGNSVANVDLLGINGGPVTNTTFSAVLLTV